MIYVSILEIFILYTAISMYVQCICSNEHVIIYTYIQYYMFISYIYIICFCHELSSPDSPIVSARLLWMRWTWVLHCCNPIRPEIPTNIPTEILQKWATRDTRAEFLRFFFSFSRITSLDDALKTNGWNGYVPN